MSQCRGACASVTSKNQSCLSLADNKQTSTHEMRPVTASTACGGCRTSNFWEDLNSFVELSHRIVNYAKEQMEKSGCKESEDESEDESEFDSDSECECVEGLMRNVTESSSYHSALSNVYQSKIGQSCDVDCGSGNINQKFSNMSSCMPMATSTPETGRGRGSPNTVNCQSNCCPCPREIKYSQITQTWKDVPPRSPSYRTGPAGGSDPTGSRGGFAFSFPGGKDVSQKSTSCRTGPVSSSDPWGTGTGFGGSFPGGQSIPGRSPVGKSGSAPWGSGGICSSFPLASTPQRSPTSRRGASSRSDPWGGGFGTSLPIGSAGPPGPGSFSRAGNVCPGASQDSFEWVDPEDAFTANMDPLYVNIEFDVVENPPKEPEEWRLYESSFPDPQTPLRPMCVGTNQYSHDNICELKSPTSSRSSSRRKNDSTFSTCRSPLYSSSPINSPSSPCYGKASPRQSSPIRSQRSPIRFEDNYRRHTA